MMAICPPMEWPIKIGLVDGQPVEHSVTTCA